MRRRSKAPRQPPRATACVIGSMDLVRPLGLSGIPCVVVVEAGDAAAYSRFTDGVIELADPAREADVLLERLLDWAGTQALSLIHI